MNERSGHDFGAEDPARAGLTFEKVTATDEHVGVLYKLLEARKFPISHTAMPTYEEHRWFVQNNPYRVWYLIRDGVEPVGSVYLLQDNCIGVSIVSTDEGVLRAAIRHIQNNWEPLPQVKSVRPAGFHVNVAPQNVWLSEALERMGARSVQITFAIDRKPA